MKRVIAIFKREYLQAVRKKSFIIMTLVTPLLMAAMMFIPSAIISRGMGGKRVAVVDGTGGLREAVASGVTDLASLGKMGKGDAPMKVDLEYVAAKGRDVAAAAKEPITRMSRHEEGGNRLDGVLVVPADALANPGARLVYYSRAATDLITQERLGRMVNRAITAHRMQGKGLDPAEIQKMLKGLDVDAVQVSRTGEQKKGGENSFLLGFLFAVLLFVPMLAQGAEILRGILQEKNDRIVEILISSVSPIELLSGKILGLAAVGLTQVAAWMAMGSALAAYIGTMAWLSGFDVSQLLRPSLIPYFGIFYLLGYMIYVCIYAVGGAICNSEKEAQQALMPAMMIVLLPWFLLGPIVLNPEGKLAVVFSLIPIFTPIIMFIRILVSDPPGWQVALSIGLTTGTIYGLFWVTAKIYRLGILSYGKRPTVPELWRWMRAA